MPPTPPYRPSWVCTKPQRSKPSSVRVSVCEGDKPVWVSSHGTGEGWVLAATEEEEEERQKVPCQNTQMLIHWGLMEKIRFPRRCCWAYTTPAIMAAGKAGGTVMVRRSRDSSTMRPVGS